MFAISILVILKKETRYNNINSNLKLHFQMQQLCKRLCT